LSSRIGDFAVARRSDAARGLGGVRSGMGADGRARNCCQQQGRARRALQEAGYAPEELSAFITEATAGDYNHLLQTVLRYADVD
jgi:hypothetical protein